jgi:hypothetical protein
MPMVIGVHGILYEYLGEETTASPWGKALRDGLRLAQHANPDAVHVNPDTVDVRVVFYGDVFRKRGAKGSLASLPI